MPEKNLELPSVDEIDFELKELPKKKEVKADVKSLQKEVQNTQQIFDQLKENLDKLKEQEFEFELKKVSQHERDLKLKEYEKKLNENIGVIESLKSSLLGLNNEYEKNKKKLEYYKQLAVSLSSQLDKQKPALEKYNKELFYAKKRAKEGEEAGILLEQKIVELEKIIAALKEEVRTNEGTRDILKKLLKKTEQDKFLESKKHEYYKRQFLDSIDSKHVTIDSIDFLKKKALKLEETNKRLETDNLLLEQKLKEMSDSFVMAQNSLENKEKMFETQNEKIKEMKKKSIENLTSFHALKERSEKLEKLNKELIERNDLLEKKTNEHLVLLKKLKEQLEFKDSDIQEEIDKTKKEYEKKLKKMIEQSTTKEIELRAYIKSLNEKTESLTNIIKEKEAKEKELLSNINFRFRSLMGEK